MEKRPERARIRWVDAARFIAYAWVFIAHFYAVFDPHRDMPFWNSFPVATLRSGLTGKLAVCFFCVLLGYFAAQKGDAGGSAVAYLRRRYPQFLIPVFVTNVCVILCARLIPGGWFVYSPALHSVTNLVKSSLLLQSDIFATFWCIQTLFLGSMLAFILSKERFPCWVQALLIVLLFYAQVVWLGACVLGSLLFGIKRHTRCGQWKLWGHWAFQLAIFVASYLLVRRPENITTYKLDCLAAFAVLFALFSNARLNRPSPKKHVVLTALSESSIWFYSLHVVIIQTLGRLLIATLSGMGGQFAFAVAFFVCFALSSVVAVLCQRAYARLDPLVTRRVTDALAKLKQRPAKPE